MPENEGLDYTREAIARHKPKKEVVNGRLHVDGVPVFEWQLNEAELKEFFPDRYLEKYGFGFVKCPFCTREELDSRTGKSWKHHIQMAHKPWYEANKSAFDALDSWGALLEYVQLDAQTRPPEVMP